MDHDWHAAHRRIVAAELIQCAGRGRAVCENGIPVVVCSTEELGFRLVDFDVAPITDGMLEVITQMGELCPAFPKGLGVDELCPAFPIINTLGKAGHSSVSVAKALSKSKSQMNRLLIDLEKAGLVERISERGGWKLTSRALPLVITRAAATGGPEVGDGR